VKSTPKLTKLISQLIVFFDHRVVASGERTQVLWLMSIHLPATNFAWPWFFGGVLDRRGEAGEVAEFEKIAEWESA
jgi:hypothetical protein